MHQNSRPQASISSLSFFVYSLHSVNCFWRPEDTPDLSFVGDRKMSTLQEYKLADMYPVELFFKNVVRHKQSSAETT